MNFRTGLGYDIHRLEAGRPLVLGGVAIPSDLGPVGHSDADVLLHALTDALLGAIAAPDIGELFSNTDPRWRGVASRVFVEEAMRRVQAAGWRVGNADLVVAAERPKLAPHKLAIRAAIAALLGVDAADVGLKATTGEGVDAIGRGEALACWASVLLLERGGA
jgi:2-C-methyl-D-erythritol 2,4-cyclodiphosphate synthase